MWNETEVCRISSIKFESNFGEYSAHEIKKDAAEYPEYEVTDNPVEYYAHEDK
jgi:hypothetical protein